MEHHLTTNRWRLGVADMRCWECMGAQDINFF